MEDKNKPVADHLIHKAFDQLQHLQYKITEYSLNSMYSFKFDNLSHFVEFLGQHQDVDDSQGELLENMFKDLNLESNSFFYVNFFEKIEGV